MDKNLNGINPQFLRFVLKTINTALSVVQNPKSEKGEFLQQQMSQNINLKAHTPLQINPQILLNRPEQALIMREMLQLPQDLKQLLTLLQAQGQTITPEAIKHLLESNSKDVISKLIKLIQQSPHSTQNHEQLKQLISLISQVVPTRDASPQEVITHLLLLYLPWLPLAEQQKLEVWYEKKGSGEAEEDSEKVAMVVFISTINFGRFKVTILIDKSQKIDIVIQNFEAGEKEGLKNILKTLKAEIKKENINAETHMSVVKQKNFTGSDRREVTISQVNNLSPLVLVAAQKVARVILEFDERVGL